MQHWQHNYREFQKGRSVQRQLSWISENTCQNMQHWQRSFREFQLKPWHAMAAIANFKKTQLKMYCQQHSYREFQLRLWQTRAAIVSSRFVTTPSHFFTRALVQKTAIADFHTDFKYATFFRQQLKPEKKHKSQHIVIRYEKHQRYISDMCFVYLFARYARSRKQLAAIGTISHESTHKRQIYKQQYSHTVRETTQ